MKTLSKAKAFNLVVKNRHTGKIKKEFTESTHFEIIFKVIDSVWEVSEEVFNTYLSDDIFKIKDIDLQTACNEVFDDEIITISFK